MKFSVENESLSLKQLVCSVIEKIQLDQYEMTMIRSDKSLEAFSPFTSVLHVALTKKVTKSKTEMSSALPILPCKLGQTAPMV